MHAGITAKSPSENLAALRRRWSWMYEIPAPVGPCGWLMAWPRPEVRRGRTIIVKTVAELAAALEADADLPSPRIPLQRAS